MNNIGIGAYLYFMGLAMLAVSGIFFSNGDLAGSTRKVRRGVWSLFGACISLIISKLFEP